jgi:anti-sigma-K factor RskA
MAMSEKPSTLSEREEIELLLPWYVMGRLDQADAAKVETALARDPSLERQFQLIREEHDQSAHGNEAIPDRPASKADRLMRDLARRQAPRAASTPSVWDRLTDFFALPELGAVRWAAAAAALVIVLQAGVISTLTLRQSGGYLPASGETVTGDRGTVALVGFVGGATTQAVIDLLAGHDMAILDGPNASGAFTVRIGPQTMSEAERDAKIEALRGRGDVVAVVIVLR